jgi:dTDP-4-dehydrorhamnose reductase
MRLLITGAGGMLGLDLQRAAAAAGHECVALARAELDITDVAAVAASVGDSEADVVINCAAATNVDGVESDSESAHAINGGGAGNVAAAATSAGAWVVQVSTDYVFDGAKREPYLESDATGPLSVYGASKLAGELAVADAAPDAHTIVRCSALFGAGGPCFPATMLRLAGEREELTVVDDQITCPTFTGHLASVLVRLSAAATRPLGVLHLTPAGQCSWYQFASEVMRQAGASTRIIAGSTAELARPAPRPAYSVMRSERGAPVLPDWRDGLDAYLAARVAA